MNAFWTILPLLFIRFVLLGILDKESLKRAAFFPPLAGKEKIAYWFYQISNVALLLYPFFIRIRTDNPLLISGLIVYVIGILVCIISTVNFARPDKNGINTKGLYKYSRNPMYIGYFFYFLGCALLTRSLILLATVIIFQISAHWIILSEERWCAKEFGEEYKRYMDRVRRYL